MHKLSLTTRQFSETTKNQLRHKRAALVDSATRRRKQETRTTLDHQSVTVRTCLGHGSKSVKQTVEFVHESTKRPSHSSAARRISNISSSRGITHRDQKRTNVHGARVLLLRHREEDTSDDPTQARQQHKVSMCPRMSRARNVRLPVLGGPSIKTQQTNKPNWHKLCVTQAET